MDAGQLHAGAGMSRMLWRSWAKSIQGALFWFMPIFNVLPASADDLPGPVEASWRGELVCEILDEDDALRVFR